MGVYPRACGGTCGRSISSMGPVYPRACGGTILVAGGGDPLVLRVYPRACGGTGVGRNGWQISGGSIPARAGEPGRPRLAATIQQWGLSPRVRGNRLGLGLHRACGGTDTGRSIPARAGEPAGPPRSLRWVYPRACGGTGLPQSPPLGVYPRACGGTAHDRGQSGDGLYPRACGGTAYGSAVRAKGSIPARAGEPLGKLIFLIRNH